MIFTLRRAATAITSAALISLAAPAQADTHKHAIIIGVSEYPGLPAGMGMTFSDWGPRNSALLWQQTLKKRGFDDIQLLTDGLQKDLVDKAHYPPIDKGLKGAIPKAKLPTRSNVEAAFNALESSLAGASHASDQVVLVFIGHGAYQPDPKDKSGVDQVFLVRDSVPPGTDKRFTGAILDKDIKRHLKKLTASSGLVWFVFDQCFAGTMTYAQRSQYLPDLTPADFDSRRKSTEFTSQTPNAFSLHPKQHNAGATMFARQDLVPSDQILTGRPEGELNWPKNYVAFYAVDAKNEAQTTYITSPLLDPLLKDSPPEITALSYYVLDALNRNPGATYADLLNAARIGYGRIDKLRGLKPLSEGDVTLGQPALR